MTSQHAAQKDILLQKKGRMLEEEGKLPKKQTCPFAHISIHSFLPTRIQMYTFPKSSDSKVPPAQRPALWVVYGALHWSKGTLCGLETHKLKEKLSASKWATYGRAVGKASYNKTSHLEKGFMGSTWKSLAHSSDQILWEQEWWEPLLCQQSRFLGQRIWIPSALDQSLFLLSFWPCPAGGLPCPLSSKTTLEVSIRGNTLLRSWTDMGS